MRPTVLLLWLAASASACTPDTLNCVCQELKVALFNFDVNVCLRAELSVCEHRVLVDFSVNGEEVINQHFDADDDPVVCWDDSITSGQFCMKLNVLDAHPSYVHLQPVVYHEPKLIFPETKLQAIELGTPCHRTAGQCALCAVQSGCGFCSANGACLPTGFADDGPSCDLTCDAGWLLQDNECPPPTATATAAPTLATSRPVHVSPAPRTPPPSADSSSNVWMFLFVCLFTAVAVGLTAYLLHRRQRRKDMRRAASESVRGPPNGLLDIEGNYDPAAVSPVHSGARSSGFQRLEEEDVDVEEVPA